ncbi:MAG: hypothetical protein SGJ13_17590, partial [Actinomycetota bacterium]|nr:hypothetical protein [Actinomycetota bacterium]
MQLLWRRVTTASTSITLASAWDGGLLRLILGTAPFALVLLGDLRRTVRLLSEEGDPRIEPPIELASDLVHLFDGYGRSGVSLTHTSVGESQALSVASSWGVYRIVQESITNAVHHAPGADISVTMTWGDDGVRVVIESGLPRAADPISHKDSAGRGQLGMS